MNHNTNDELGLLADMPIGGELDIEEELRKFEAEERDRLGLPSAEADQWNDPLPSTFTRKQREHTTLLVCGLTMAHDLFIQAGLRGIGYKVKAMDVPNNDALQYGREFGNRGQCNPTYFTVGNLIKYLTELEAEGLTKKEIVANYLFVTAGACGPCRFGTYVTEYRKALRDSGFDGFRVLLFQQTGGLKQATGEEVGLEMNPAFFWALSKGIIVGDVLNALGYRIRPYEVQPGATDAALERAKALVSECLETKGNLVKALYKCRRILSKVEVDRTRVRPKVSIIGEFWAMTTEGDGNYGLQRFLEGEGAEVEIQLVTAWMLYMVWQSRWDTNNRSALRGADEGKFGLNGVDVRKRMITLAVAEKALAGLFQTFAKALGLNDYHLPDMNQLAEVSHEFYDNNLRGGEGHMEVGKLIQNIAKSKVDMTLSVKPFGCMPSSSVSDGVQSLITEMYPGGIFLPIETNGDGAVNVYSRVQMQLFKAKQLAAKEVEAALADTDQTMEQVQEYLAKHPKLASAFHRSPHMKGCTTADLVYDVASHRKRFGRIATSVVGFVRRRSIARAAQENLLRVARVAAAKASARSTVVAADEPRPEGMPEVPEGRKSLRVLN